MNIYCLSLYNEMWFYIYPNLVNIADFFFLRLQFPFYLSLKLLVSTDDSHRHGICIVTGIIYDFIFPCLSFNCFPFDSSEQEITLNNTLCLRMQLHVNQPVSLALPRLSSLAVPLPQAAANIQRPIISNSSTGSSMKIKNQSTSSKTSCQLFFFLGGKIDIKTSIKV